MSSRFSDEALMRIDDLLPSAPKPQPPTPDQFVVLPTPSLPLMQAIAMHALYQMAFEQAQADARASERYERYEPKWN
jgi:hypothetical protein